MWKFVNDLIGVINIFNFFLIDKFIKLPIDLCAIKW